MKKLLSIIVVALVSACAYSPQQITINPVVDTAAESYGNGRTVAVSVKDERENKVLGTRGGIYKETSTITLANSLTDAIARATQARLAVQGFNVNSAEPAADMTIFIEQLTYDTPADSVGKKVALDAVARVEIKAGNETFTGRYKTNSERQTVVTPSMAKNEEMINALLSDTLTRLFSDPKVKAFLSNI